MMPGETVLSGGEGHDQNPHVSEFRVMRSPAGWYIGTVYIHCDWEKTGCKECEKEPWMAVGWTEPNSRETDYFEIESAAMVALEIYKATGDMPKDRRDL